MGSAPIAVPTLQYLDDHHDLQAVITQPDRPKGRKREMAPTAVKEEALRRGLVVLEPRKLRASEFLEALKSMAADVIVVMAYGRRVPSEVLSMPTHGCVNIHGSLLPEHRGPCPIERAIMRGDVESGITTFFMDEGFDTGDVILMRSVPIAPDDTGGSLREKLSHVAVDVIDETLRRLAEGTAPRVPQDLRTGTHAAVLTREDARIEWSRAARAIDRQVRACEPEPGAFTFFRDLPLKVRRVAVLAIPEEIKGAQAPPRPPAPGSVIAADRESGLRVAAGDGKALTLVEVQPAGKRWMDGADFVAGYRPRLGESLDVVPVSTA